ncbi:flavin-containing monooxygenase [Mycobacterium sp. C31M]
MRDAVDVVVVGAGFAGLYQLYALRRSGYTVQVIEAGDDVGGTWYWNRYPGARCDVESMDYSYSFSPELEQEWTWSEKYATQPEILRYIHHVADRFELRPHIRLSTRVTSAVYEDSTHSWTVSTNRGDVIRARFLIMATGCLSVPKVPEIPGAERFSGQILHTSDWPHDPVDFLGKRVAVIGTGSSGIQTIPLVAEQADEVIVFQRTPNFALPARNRPLTADEIAERKATYRQWREKARISDPGVPATRSALAVSDQERTAAYQAAWDKADLPGIVRAFTDILLDAEANKTVADFLGDKIREIVENPETAEILTPRTYPFGTKRPCLDTDYYRTFNCDHVHLVDVQRHPLVEITADGLRNTEREYRVDTIIFATGFDAMTGALLAVDIRGRGDRSLKEEWEDGPRTNMGLAIAGFPNMFIITGPLSPAVLSNVVVEIEAHVDWITACIEHLDQHGYTEVETTAEAQDTWVRRTASLAAKTLYPQAASWYMGANVPGKPRVFMIYVGGVGSYRTWCDRVAADGYIGFAFDRVPHTP